MAESLRERKKAQTRDALVTAGMNLFAERSFDSVTVAEIAAAADVSPRTFHRYFPDKVELLFADDELVQETVGAALRNTPLHLPPAAAVAVVLSAVCEPLVGRRTELLARDQLLSDVPVLRARDLAKRAVLEQLIAEHLAQRLGLAVDSDVRPRWWAGVALATFAASFRVWLHTGGDLKSHLQSAVALLSDQGAGAASHPAG